MGWGRGNGSGAAVVVVVVVRESWMAVVVSWMECRSWVLNVSLSPCLLLLLVPSGVTDGGARACHSGVGGSGNNVQRERRPEGVGEESGGMGQVGVDGAGPGPWVLWGLWVLWVLWDGLIWFDLIWLDSGQGSAAQRSTAGQSTALSTDKGNAT